MIAREKKMSRTSVDKKKQYGGVMEKDFDRWNSRKKRLDRGGGGLADFHERELWWCAIGVNVGREQHSHANDFGRPVIIIKKFTQDIFLGILLTTQVRKDNFRFRSIVHGIENDILVLQMRTLDRKRLLRKISMMPKKDYERLLAFIKQVT